MHIKITQKQHERLMQTNSEIKRFNYGSHLFKMVNGKSDKDILIIYDPNRVFNNTDLKIVSHLPNIHSFQYDDNENNTQYVWMTYEQFYNGVITGDGIINIDIAIFYGVIPFNELFTYNIIKAYLGVAKRDLKQHNKPKKIFHAHKSLYIAQSLMNKEMPSISNIRAIGLGEYTLTAENLIEEEKKLRIKLNKMLDDGEIFHYYLPKVDDDLLTVMVNANNVREFKYE